MTIRLSNMHATYRNNEVRYTGIGFNANVVSAAANSSLIELRTSDDLMFVVYTNGDAVLTGNLYVEGTIFGNGISGNGGGGTGTVTQVNTGNGISGGPITNTGTLRLIPNTGIVVNTSGIFVNSAYIGTLTSNNATYAYGKSESNLNVNSASTSTSASQLGGKTEGNLNVNSAATATSASTLGGKTESNLNVNSALFANFASYVLGNTGIVSNSTGVFVNSAYIATITANNATYAYGKGEGSLNVNSSLFSNLASYIIANNGIISNSSGVFVRGNTGLVVNSTGVFVNSAYISTIDANNASYLGGTAASGYQTTAGLASNVATMSANYATYVLANNGIVSNSSGVFVKGNTGLVVNSTGVFVNATYISTIDANNASYLGGTVASGYQTTAGLAANVATLSANYATYVLANSGIVSNSSGVFVRANNGLIANSTGLFVNPNTGLVVNSTGVFVNSAYIATIDANNSSYLGGVVSSGYQTTSGLASNVATLSANYATYVLANSGIVSNSSGVFVRANNGLIANSTGVFVNPNTGIVVNSTGVFVNSAYIATIDANNSSYLGGVVSSGYQTTAGLSANVATLSANYATYVLANNGIVSNSTGVFVKGNTGLVVNSTGVFVNAAYIAALDANNAAYLGGTAAASYVKNTDSRVLSGNIQFTGTNVTVSGLLNLTGTLRANGTDGSPGQILASNGTATYWASPGGTGTVTQVDTGVGLTGGPITGTGTISVVPNTGIVANSTGVFVNATYIGTISSNNAAFLGGVAAASYVQNTDSRTLSGNLVYTAANVAFTGVINIVGGLRANGTLGSAGQILKSNGTAPYWVDGATGTVTSVAAGDGLAGGPITGTGTLYVASGNGLVAAPGTLYVVTGNGLFANDYGVQVQANNGLIVNSTGIYVKGNTGLVVNSTGVFVNATYISTLDANNSSYLGGTAASGYQTSAGLAANVATLSANYATYVLANSGIVSNSSGVFVKANNGLIANSSGVFVNPNTGIVVNSSGLFVNSTYISTIDANNASYLGGTAASGYQTTSGLAANVATLSANYATYVLANSGIVSNSTGVFVKANNGIIANSSGVFINPNTGVVVNSSGVFVNSSYIATISSNNSSYLNGKTEGNLNVNSAAFASTANNAQYLNGVAGASYLYDTLSNMTLTGNLSFGGANINIPNLLDLTGSLRANGSIGSNGQVLTSNGTKPYWKTPTTGTLTQVDTGNGLTGGPITSTGTVSVLPNTGIVANSSGVFVNSSYIATISSNNAAFLGGTAAASYVQNTDTRTLSGNLTFSGTNVQFTGLLDIVGSLRANGTVGSPGQVLASNGTTPYWLTVSGTGTVTQVNTGNGLTGGPISTTGTVSVLANSGIVSNSSGVFVNANNGIVANSTGVFVFANTGLVANSTGLHVSVSNVQIFNSSGTWTKPTNSPGTLAIIECIGGGGSGGSNRGGGGGGGSYNFIIKPLSTLSATETVTIGLGGVASNSSNSGTSGGTTSFGTHLSAYGGCGGGGAASNKFGGHGGSPFTAPLVPGVSNSTNMFTMPPAPIYTMTVAISSSTNGTSASIDGLAIHPYIFGAAAPRNMTALGLSPTLTAISYVDAVPGSLGFGGGGGGGFASNTLSGQILSNSTVSTSYNTNLIAAPNTTTIAIGGGTRPDGGAGGGGGGLSTQATTLAPGGVSGNFRCANGGVGGNNTVAASAGLFPGGGGGGGGNATSFQVSGAGANGQCIVTII